MYEKLLVDAIVEYLLAHRFVQFLLCLSKHIELQCKYTSIYNIYFVVEFNFHNIHSMISFLSTQS